MENLIATASDNENFLKNIIIGDEIWPYDYDIEIKVELSQ